MVTPAMIAILAHGVKFLLTLVTRIFKQSREVFAIHMPFLFELTGAHMSTDFALEVTLAYLCNVVVQVKLDLGSVYQLIGFWLSL